MTETPHDHDGGLWAWSGRIYQREGVKSAALAFQGAGGDVNLAFWCAWLAARGRAPSAGAVKHAATISDYMQSSIMTPLRSARDAIKEPPIFIDHEGAADARSQLLDIELDIERLQHQALAALETQPQSDGPPKQRAIVMLRELTHAVNPSASSNADAAGERLLNAIFTQALYTLTRVSPANSHHDHYSVVAETLNEAALTAKLADLREEHRALDAAVKALSQDSAVDQLKVARLKRRKLQLKDEIAAIEDQLHPDIIA